MRRWLRGLKDAVVWVVESVWDWLTKPRVEVVMAGLLLLGACDRPSPTPTPTPSPTPTVEPTPTPTPECVPAEGEAGWTAWKTLPPEHLDTMDAVEDSLGSPCGLDPEDTLRRLGAALRSSGLCAGKKDDAVFVRRTTDTRLWEQYHAVAYATGCWTIRERKYVGTWMYVN